MILVRNSHSHSICFFVCYFFVNRFLRYKIIRVNNFDICALLSVVFISLYLKIECLTWKPVRCRSAVQNSSHLVICECSLSIIYWSSFYRKIESSWLERFLSLIGKNKVNSTVTMSHRLCFFPFFFSEKKSPQSIISFLFCFFSSKDFMSTTNVSMVEWILNI